MKQGSPWTRSGSQGRDLHRRSHGGDRCSCRECVGNRRLRERCGPIAVCRSSRKEGHRRSGNVFLLTKHAFGYEALPPFNAKGKREPVGVPGSSRSLWRPRPAVSELRAPPRDVVHEMVLMRTVWERASSARQPHLISVMGEAGIGKSRLAAEIGSEVEAAGGRVMWARSHPYDQQTPYRGAAQLIRQAVAIFENEAVEAARRKLELFASLVPHDEVASITRYLSLCSALDPRTCPRDHRPPLRHTQVVRESVGARALMIVFDDIQWADEASLDLVGYLSKHFQDHRIVIVALARPELVEVRPAWGAGQPAFTAAAESSESRRRQQDGLRPTHPSRAALGAKVVATAEGNPLFIEELVARSKTRKPPKSCLPRFVPS